jgi:thiol-disulfide isomerase/thioredoxin
MSLCRRHFLALAAGAAACAIPAAGRAQSANWATAPFAAADNTATSLSAFFGKPIVLNFWATWCVPCRSEMPSLDALAASMGDEAWILPVSVDDGGMPIIDQFYQQYNLTRLGRYHDHVGALKTAFGVTAYPTSYLINSRAAIVGAYARAFDWNSAVARAAVSALR